MNFSNFSSTLSIIIRPDIFEYFFHPRMNTNTFITSPLKKNFQTQLQSLNFRSNPNENRIMKIARSQSPNNHRIKTTAKILLEHEVRINTGTIIWAFTNHESNERETYGRDITSERNKPIVDQRRTSKTHRVITPSTLICFLPVSPPRNWDSSIDDAELRKQERSGTERWNPKCASFHRYVGKEGGGGGGEGLQPEDRWRNVILIIEIQTRGQRGERLGGPSSP